MNTERVSRSEQSEAALPASGPTPTAALADVVPVHLHRHGRNDVLRGSGCLACGKRLEEVRGYVLVNAELLAAAMHDAHRPCDWEREGGEYLREHLEAVHESAAAILAALQQGEGDDEST